MQNNITQEAVWPYYMML